MTASRIKASVKMCVLGLLYLLQKQPVATDLEIFVQLSQADRK